MKCNNYSVNLHWDKRYPKAGTTDVCPIQLAINLNGLQFKVSLKLYATKTDFTTATRTKGGGTDIKDLRKTLNDYITKAENILDKLPNPTRESFQRLFKSDANLTNNKTDISYLLNEYIEQVKSEDRIKTAQNLSWALKSFKRYKAKIAFEDINESWLNGYKSWMLKQGNSATTVQIYLRNLRTIFNLAIKEGYVSEKHYPFKNYVIGTSVKSKSVLYAPDLKKLWEYDGKTLREKRAKDYFFFLYLSGMNPKDMFYLKFKDIKGDTLSYIREKTKRTNTVADKQIILHIHDEMKRIIHIWGNKPSSPDDYVFPILNNYKTVADKEKRRHKMQRQINDNLKAIGVKLCIEEKLILSICRHSFATALKLSGTPIAFISDFLGHSSVKTSEHYLKSIPTDKAREISNTLLNFNS